MYLFVILLESPLLKALQIYGSRPDAVKTATSLTYIYIIKFKGNTIGLALNGWWIDLKDHLSKPNTAYVLKSGKVIKCRLNVFYIPPKNIQSIHDRALVEAEETKYEIGHNISKLWNVKESLSGFNRVVFAPSAHFLPGIHLLFYILPY